MLVSFICPAVFDFLIIFFVWFIFTLTQDRSYGDYSSFDGGGRPEVPLRTLFMPMRAPG